MDKEIMKIADQLKALSNVAVLQYTNIVNDILDEKITDEQEIACILDGMLNFCQFNKMLLLFKQIWDVMYDMIHTLEYRDFVNQYYSKNSERSIWIAEVNKLPEV